MMKRFLMIAALGFAATPALANDIDVAGLWATPDKGSHVKIEDCGDGTPCGRVAWFNKGPADQKDVNNSDPELRDRPIMGLLMISAFERKGKGWKNGTIYDPEAGKSYASKLKLMDDGNLEVKGCISFLCQTQVWTPVADSGE